MLRITRTQNQDSVLYRLEGKLTGLKSRAMTSPCRNIRIPLNESSDDKSQIEEFLNPKLKVKIINLLGLLHRHIYK